MVDVTAGVRLVLDLLADDAPVVFPVPGYSPQFAVAEMTGRERIDLVVDPDAERAEIDLDRLDAMFSAGARTLLLRSRTTRGAGCSAGPSSRGSATSCSGTGPGSSGTRSTRRWSCPGAAHTSYLDLEGTHDHAVQSWPPQGLQHRRAAVRPAPCPTRRPRA